MNNHTVIIQHENEQNTLQISKFLSLITHYNILTSFITELMGQLRYMYVHVKHGTDLFHTYSKMIVIVWELEV